MSQIGNASIEVVSGMTVEVSFPGPQGPPGTGGGGDVATDLLWDAKGDLAVGTGSNTASRLPVGTNGHVIVADSNEATGIKWLNPTKALVGLSDVDNTADLAKPISTSTQNALDGKAAATRSITTGDGLSGGGDLSADRTLAVDLAADPGLEISSAKLRAKIKANGGLVRDGDGLSVSLGTGATDAAAGNHTHSDATGSVAGFLSASDKSKLDGIASGATANTGTVTSVAAGTGLTGGTITGSGTIAADFGSAAGTICQGNDGRLSDERTPADNTVSTAKLQDGAVTYAKMQDVSATDKILGRSTAGSGDVEEIACTAAGRALLDDADAAAQRTTLGLGSAATSATSDFAAASHSHGNITSAGAINSTAGLPVVTGASGVLETLALGTAGQALRVNSGATGLEFGTISGAGSVATDTLWDAKGDLAVGTGADTASRLAVGTNGQVLTADSNETTGVKWSTISNTGTVTSVGTGDGLTGGAITTSGTLSVSLAANPGLEFSSGALRAKVKALGGVVRDGDGLSIDSSLFAAAAHTHGNITATGSIGSTANLPLITTTGGLVTTGAFGTSANQFAEGNHTHAWADITSKPSDFTPSAHTHGLTESYVGEIAAAADQDYTIDLRVPVSRVVTEFSIICTSGSCTAALKNGADTIVGSVSVSSVIATKTGGDLDGTHKSLDANDKLVLTISANSSALRVQFCVKYTATTGAIS